MQHILRTALHVTRSMQTLGRGLRCMLARQCDSSSACLLMTYSIWPPFEAPPQSNNGLCRCNVCHTSVVPHDGGQRPDEFRVSDNMQSDNFVIVARWVICKRVCMPKKRMLLNTMRQPCSEFSHHIAANTLYATDWTSSKISTHTTLTVHLWHVLLVGRDHLRLPLRSSLFFQQQIHKSNAR